MAKRVAPGSTAKSVGVGELHTIKTGLTLGQNVDGHPPRTESEEFVKSRATLHKIDAIPGFENVYARGDGSAAIQAHHGGSIWLMGDDDKPFMVPNIFGVEWNEQFDADFTIVDMLRRIAKKMVDAFKKTRPWLRSLGYDPDPVLDTPVTDSATCSKYVDSLFNACVPLPQKVHTGTISKTDERSAGIHNYPVPAWNNNFICRKDFKPFVVIAKGVTVKVGSVSYDRSDKRVRVHSVHGDPKHPLHKKHQAAEAKDQALVLEAHDPVAIEAHGGEGA